MVRRRSSLVFITMVARALTVLAVLAGVARPGALGAQDPDSAIVAQNDSVTIRLVDVEVRAAVQALAQYLDRPVVFGAMGAASSARVSLETPQPVPRARVVDLLRGVLESNNLELFADTSGGAPGIYRVRAREMREAPRPEVARTLGPAGPVELFVIRLGHARATDVAATVNALYGRAGALGELGAREATLGDELRENRAAAAQPGVASSLGTMDVRSATLSGDVTIVPDPRTNSLLIRASRSDFELIQAAVQQVDIRPLQVLIEVIIAEVRRDRGFAFGVDARLPEQQVVGSENTRIKGSTSSGLGLTDFALEVMGIGNVDLDVTLRAEASRGNVRIMSRPIVIATNNEVAEILVGSQRPFVAIQRDLPTDSPVQVQNIQYKDVGTELSVRPTISGDGYVTLEVTQEVNQATSEVAFDAPVISTRSVQTQILVKDGQTVVLGGLTDRQRDTNQGGVPVLSSIPLLGGLFGRASRRAIDTELFVFITPKILASDADADAATEPLRRRAGVEP